MWILRRFPKNSSELWKYLWKHKVSDPVSADDKTPIVIPMTHKNLR